MTSTRRHRAGNIPAEVTSFVGRRREVAEVRRRMSISRVVTLTGAGGVGKTRLALRVAAESQRVFPEGVWLVELADLQEPSLLAQTIATTFGLDHSRKEPIQLLTEHLRDAGLLLVLDNCEHIVQACAALVTKLLSTAPEARFLLTSRHALGISAEHLFAVPPLPIPDRPHSPSVDAVALCDSVKLLVNRAAAVSPEFAVTPENVVAISAICARLDGIPLAIELAAARLRSLSPDQLLERLEGSFHLLSGGDRTVMPRHRTLDALIEWSYSLCSEDERYLWERLAVFIGGFDLDAAEHVCAADGLPATSVVDIVDRLVAQSILIPEAHGRRMRFRMLEPIRQYGYDRLAASGEEELLRRRHRDYYNELGQRCVAEWFGPDQDAWLATLRAEHANIRSALEFCAKNPAEVQAGLSLAAAMKAHWHAGFLREGRHWLDHLLRLDKALTEARAHALLCKAWIALLQGDMPAATTALDECRGFTEQHHDVYLAAYVAQVEGTAAYLRGDLSAAVKLCEEAIAGHEQVDDLAGVINTSFQLALALTFLGHGDQAALVCENAVELGEPYGERFGRSYALWALGIVRFVNGDPRSAVPVARQSLTVLSESRDDLGAVLNIELLAWIAAATGEYQDAARLLGNAEAVWRALGATMSTFGPQAQLGEQAKSRTLNALGEQRFRKLFDKQARLSAEHAVNDSLNRGRTVSTRESDPMPLTRREREVADLVAQGLTNREIAASLVLSIRTVDSHIENMLGKLGFAKRTQIAAWVAAQRDNQDSPADHGDHRS